MPDPRTPDDVRSSTEKAKDYFSKVQGWEPPASEKKEPEPEPEEEKPSWQKPDVPLSEAEKAWKGIMGK